MSSWSVASDCLGETLTSNEPPVEYLSKVDRMRPHEEEGGMFQNRVSSFAKYPCSLVFEETAQIPVSSEAENCIDTINSLVGPVGAREGFYGAGGGPVHLFYFGKLQSSSTNTSEVFPNLKSLLADVMSVTPSLLDPLLSWVSSVDICHQHLFPRTSAEVGEARDDFLHLVYDALDEAGNVVEMPYALPDMTKEEFPHVKKPYLLFVQPYFRMYHSGNCPSSCPRDTSMCVEIVGSTITNSEDLSEAPTFAFWRLTTGEVMALCYWDYIG